VDITNDSNLDLRINNGDVLASNAADPELIIDADEGLSTFDVDQVEGGTFNARAGGEDLERRHHIRATGRG
jgi:hypothetical protein